MKKKHTNIACETVTVDMKDNKAVLINKSDYDETVHGKIVEPQSEETEVKQEPKKPAKSKKSTTKKTAKKAEVTQNYTVTKNDDEKFIVVDGDEKQVGEPHDDEAAAWNAVMELNKGSQK